MTNLKTWLCSSVLAALTLAPAVAGAGDAAEANSSSTTNSANATNANGSSTAADPSPTPSLATGSVNVKALLNVLVTKGVLAPSEASAIRNAAPDMELQLLVQALARKGVLNAADVAAASTTTAAQPEASTDSATAMATPDPQQAAGNGASQAVAPVPPPPPGPTVVAAIAPLRVLPVDPPKKDGLNAAFKMGGVKMTPYGFLKATADFDSSSPNGDDFPFVGLFLGSTSILNTGPTQASEFHLKARSARIGANFEWPDLSPKIVLTGRVEGDFEGNFSEVDNRDVSSIRSNAYQLRLAYVRMDYNATENTDLYFEGGQDWTIFGSSALPNILETTFLGAYYGDIYERSPQFQFGMVQKLSSSHNFKISPTFALMMPSSGQIEKLGSLGLAGQIAQAEREGADSGRPEIEGRLAFQFQLDDAKGVAPAQVLWSGFRGWRTSIVTNSNGAVNECSATVTTGCVPVSLVNSYVAAYPNGFRDTSTMYGNQLAVQLPTRWFTLVASGYRGGDMRFFFGGQVNSYFTDTNGLSNPVTFTTVDGGPLAAAGGAVLATNGSGQIVVAPQRPVRSFGGFVNLGLPLSRWFDADPKGHNAGWQLYLDFGKDQVVHRDLINPGASGVLPLLMGKMAAVTLYYKLNPYCSFGFEQSIYATRLEPGVDYTIAGRLSNLWQDHRTEFGPIFTF